MPVSKDVLLLAGSRRIATPLRVEGYRLTVATDHDQVLHYARRRVFDVIVLDVHDATIASPIVEELRREVETPIAVLNASGEPPEAAPSGVETISEPFEMPELLARLRRITNRDRPGESEAEQYCFGEVRVDVGGTEIVRHGEKILVSAREFELLTYLLRHPGETISRERLLTEVWGYRGAVATRTVDMHVASLRRKLEADPKYPRFLITVKRFGYKFPAHITTREIGEIRDHDHVA
jgi:DNA-binding response OmpR family regulator